MGHANWVTIGKFEELTGYTEAATRSKIARGDWREGKEWKKAPDGRVLMSMQGYEQWVDPIEPVSEKHPAAPSRSTSTTGTAAAGNG
jgi:hypothetical protein